MVTEVRSFLELTAKEVMSRDVVALPREMSLPMAARLLSRSQISGAPVVDGEGRCIGVLSAIDFMNWTGSGKKANPPRPGAQSCFCSEWQAGNVENLPDERIEQFMTPDPVTVSPDAPLGTVAWCMVDAHIHRVIVV